MSDQPNDNPVVRVLERPVRVLQIVMGWALLALCFATAYEILGRRLFGVSLQGVNEIGAYMLAIGSTWGFSMALLQRAHSRVDFLFPRFPRPMRNVLNLLAALTLAGLAVFSAWEGWSVLKDTLRWQARASTPLETPLWIPQSLWL
ncbi:MAG: TRAP transporter small permease subunit, partial [Xanthobacteraceae bacterium]